MLAVNRREAEAWRGCTLCLSVRFFFDGASTKVYNQDDMLRRAMSAIPHLCHRDGEVLTRRPYIVSRFATELYT
jgi:hypothetical protein